MNKKELAKNEEDIIETYSNSLTVHETKLKVSKSQHWSMVPMSNVVYSSLLLKMMTYVLWNLVLCWLCNYISKFFSWWI